MPIYGYRCAKCGHEFEIQQRIGDAKKKKCPECKKMSLQRIFYPTGLHFKGKGFYSTDADRTSVVKSDSKSDTIKDGGKTSKDAIKRKD